MKFAVVPVAVFWVRRRRRRYWVCRSAFRRRRDRYEADRAEALYDRRLGRVSASRAPVDEVAARRVSS